MNDKYSSKNGAIFCRRMLSRWFGKKNKRPAKECWELEWFIRNFICGCGWDVKWWGDFCDFNTEFGNEYLKRLPEWLAENRENNDKWAVIEKQKGKTVWAFFTRSRLVSEWEPVVFVPDY